MLKIIEIFESNNEHKLREVSLNPSKIIKITPIEISTPPQGLKTDEFVRIYMEGGLSFMVVESIDSLEAKIRGPSVQNSLDRLLKG